jgi:hypothetical protein
LSAAKHCIGRRRIFYAAGPAYTGFNVARRIHDTKRGRFNGNLEVPIMKRLIQAVALAMAVSGPVVAHAQSNQPLTRAQVRAEVKALKQAGFQPSDWFYPASIQSAEAKIAQQNGAGYGSARDASSESGR